MNQVSKHSILGKILLGIPSPQKNRPEITTALLSLRVGPRTSGIPHKTSPYEEALGTQNHANGRAIRCPSTLAMNSDGKRWVLAVSSNSMPLKSGPRRCILAGNYGEARQSTFSAHATDCPNAISAHQNYYFWGPHTSMGEFASKGPQLDTSRPIESNSATDGR